MNENQKIELVEKQLLDFPQVDVPLVHLFGPDVYLRTVKMPKGSIVIGHEHKTEHFNIVLSGSATLGVGVDAVEIKAPMIFVSKPGVRKVLQIHEDMIWTTIHPTKETDLTKLEDQLIVKSETFKQKALQCHG